MENVMFETTLESVKTKEGIEVPDKKIVLRTDTRQPLGIVGNRYEALPNRELFPKVEEALNKLGIDQKVIYEQRNNGARCFMYLDFPGISKEIKKGDVVSAGLRVQNSFDGSLKAGLSLFAKRLVCSNGMTASENITSITQRHTRNVNVNIITSGIKENLRQFNEVLIPFWNALNEYDVKDEAYHIIDELVPSREDRKEDPEVGRRALLPTKYREDIINRYNQSQFRGDTRNGSMWDLYNTFTEVATHVISKNVSDFSSRRYDQEIFKRFSEMVKN